MHTNKMKWFLIPLIAVVSLFAISSSSNTSYFEISKNLDIYASLYKELNTYYVDDLEPSKLIQTSIHSMLKSLDPYTNFISEADMEGYKLQTTGKYGGVGALIRVIDDYVVISEPYEGYAADKYGLQAGDKIVEVEGNSTKGKNSEEISKLLKGQAGTKVSLTVSRLQKDGKDKLIEVEIEREEIKIKNVSYHGMINDHIGFIRLSNFTQKAGQEVRDALKNLKENNDLKGVVLDLRGNPGGLLNEAVNVSNVFIEKGQEIVSTKGKVSEWDKTFKTVNPAEDTEIPIAVLINSESASASEIVSGSIQDLDRGVVLGERSFGKGLVQTTRSLSYNTKLKVTTAKYYIPSGRCIQAINYAEKNEDGSVAKIPDSLQTAFKTSIGRTVYDGGGISPDIDVKNPMMSNIAISLIRKNLIFKYATIYRVNHDQIPPAKTFKLSDEEYQQFIEYLQDKEYDYTTESEELLSDLKEASKDEMYFDAIEAELDSLMSKIKHDKNKDLRKHKTQIKALLEEEIASRYYLSAGRLIASFDTDKYVNKAVEVLENNSDYQQILSVSADQK
ncbi:MAG: S41 family peptidase [Chitinophagales bacterium]